MIIFGKVLPIALLFFFSPIVLSESPPIYQLDNTYNAVIESTNTNTLQTTTCQGSLISESWMLTSSRCIKNINNSQTIITLKNTSNEIYLFQVKQEFKFKQKKFSLLQLNSPAENIAPVKLLRYPLLPKHGKFMAEILNEDNTSIESVVKGRNKKTIKHKEQPESFVNSSLGSAWVIRTDNLGDVQIGFTKNKKAAAQVSFLANKIDKVIAEHSGESVEWVDRQTLIDIIECEADGTCIETPVCPDGVLDCGDVCDWAIDCSTPEPPLPPVGPDGCPEGVLDCGDPCDWAIDCTPEPPLPPVGSDGCPEGVLDCGDPCDWAIDCTIPLAPPVANHFHDFKLERLTS